MGATLAFNGLNNNLIINSTSLQPLPLLAVNILRHMARYGTPARERVFLSHSTNSCNCSKRSETDTFVPASFNGTRNCSHMEKFISSANSLSFYKLFYIQCFLFAGDDVKTKIQIYISVKCFDIYVNKKYLLKNFQST